MSQRNERTLGVFSIQLDEARSGDAQPHVEAHSDKIAEMKIDPMDGLLDLIAARSRLESILGAVRLEMQITRQADNVLRCVAHIAVREILRFAAV